MRRGLALAAALLLAGAAVAAPGRRARKGKPALPTRPADEEPAVAAPPRQTAEPATAVEPPPSGQPAQTTPPPSPVVDTLTRGELQAIVRVKGTVRAEEVFRLNSTIEGRVEEVLTGPLSWVGGGKPLAYVLNKELAAMIDAKASTPGQILEQRWQAVYKPTPIECTADCFVLKVFAKEKAWIQPDTLLFEAARKLRLVGRVRPHDSHLVKRGQVMTYWPVSDPKRRHQARVEHFVLDVQGEKVEPGGTMTVLLDSGRYLDPGTEWEGTVIAQAKKDVLRVPTKALIVHDGETFLPIRVSTGITTSDLTEITSGVSAKDRFLILPTTGTCLQTHAPAYQSRPQPRTPGERSDEDRLRRRRERSGIEPLPEEKPDKYDNEFPSDLRRGSGYE